MKATTKSIILTIGSLIIGYISGNVINFPQIKSNLGLGDISKVNKYKKNAIFSKDTSALEEKLKSDTLAFNEELVTVGLINSKMNDFATLIDYSIIVAADKEEFCEEINSLINVRELSENAIQASKVASASLEYIASGEANELATDYEQAAQNMIVTFLMVDRQAQLGKQFVDIADKYLENKSKEDSPEIALARDLWAEYCAESAYLNYDKKELAYWDGQKRLCNMDILDNVIKRIPYYIRKFESSIFANKIESKDLRARFAQNKLSTYWPQVVASRNSNEFIEAKAFEQKIASKIETSELSLNISHKLLANSLLILPSFANIHPTLIIKSTDFSGYLNSNNLYYYIILPKKESFVNGFCLFD